MQICLGANGHACGKAACVASVFCVKNKVDIRQARGILGGFFTFEHPEPVCGVAEGFIRLYGVASIADVFMRCDDHGNLGREANAIGDEISLAHILAICLQSGES